MKNNTYEAEQTAIKAIYILIPNLDLKTKEEVTKVIQELTGEVYDIAYEDGFEQGEEEGYEDGNEDGYDTGHDSGYAEGHEHGFSEGYEEAYNKACEDARGEAGAPQ